MLKLSDATQKSRYIIIIVLVIMVLCTVSGMLRRAGNDPVVLPTVGEDRKFGDLPPLKLSELNYEYKDNLLFELNTISGRLPDDVFNIVYIYTFNEPVQSLTAKEDAIRLASELGYFKVPQVQNSRNYKWSSLLGTRILTYDSLTKDVSIQTDLKKDPYLKINHDILSNTEIYKEQFKSFADGLTGTIFPDDYKLGNATVEYLIFKDGKFEETIDASSRADYFKINLFRQVPINIAVATDDATSSKSSGGTSIGGIDLTSGLDISNDSQKENYTYAPVFNESPFTGNINAIIAGDNVEVANIVEFNMAVHEINYEDVGAYRILSYEEAYNKLLNGEGSLVYISDFGTNKAKKASKFSVNSANIGYFESKEFDQYLLPVYVFSGIMTFDDESRADFYFYVPAVR